MCVCIKCNKDSNKILQIFECNILYLFFKVMIRLVKMQCYNGLTPRMVSRVGQVYNKTLPLVGVELGNCFAERLVDITFDK